MALTIAEGTAVNVLLQWALDESPAPVSYAGPDEGTRVRDAAMLLAKKTNKALSAGITPAEVEARW